MSDDFDWSQDDAIVVHFQPALAVYTNPKGTIVVRQEGEWDEDGDTYLYVTRANVVVLVTAILQEAGLEHLAQRLREPSSSGGTISPDSPSRPKSSGAARSKAYRDKLKSEAGRDGRDGRDAGDAGVTVCDVTRDAQPDLYSQRRPDD